MKKLLFIVCIINLCTGCTAQSWKYTSEPKVYKNADTQYTLVVPPLRDERSNENSMSGYFISMIPLVPYGTSTINVPDRAMNAKLTEEFSKAMAEEIENATIFKSSEFQFNKTGADLYLVGNLKSSQQIWNSTFYGLSLPGDLLWLLGLPNGKYHFGIELEYKLMDSKNNTYFTKTYTAKNSNLTGIYYGMGDNGFEKAMKNISKEVVWDLRNIAPTVKLKK